MTKNEKRFYEILENIFIGDVKIGNGWGAYAPFEIKK